MSYSSPPSANWAAVVPWKNAEIAAPIAALDRPWAASLALSRRMSSWSRGGFSEPWTWATSGSAASARRSEVSRRRSASRSWPKTFTVKSPLSPLAPIDWSDGVSPATFESASMARASSASCERSRSPIGTSGMRRVPA